MSYELLLRSGYTIYPICRIRHLIQDRPKVNLAPNKHVYEANNQFYTLYDHYPVAQRVCEYASLGVYREISKQLNGIIFDDDKPCGYVSDKCTLHLNSIDISMIRLQLQVLLLETGLGIHDFHSKNFGKFGKFVCLLDLDAIRPAFVGMNSKNTKYNKFLKGWGLV